VVATLKQLKICTDKVKGAGEMFEALIWFTSCDTTVTFIVDDLLLGVKSRNHPLFVTGYTKE